MKITKATLKSFVKKNENILFINVKSEFEGMVDGCEEKSGGFKKSQKSTRDPNRSLGICGINLVGYGSRNSFEKYEDEKYIGIDVYNCLGRFIVAIEKNISETK